MPPPVIRIESVHDPRVELYHNIRDRDLYGRENVFIAESELVIRRLLPTAHRLRSLLLTPPRYEVMRDVLQELPDSIPVYIADLGVLCQIAGFHVHRGALAVADRPEPERLSIDYVLGSFGSLTQLHLLLAEGITNIDNMGGLFRSAAAFGLDAVMLDPTCCDPLYRKAVRVSMGHVLSVPWARSTDWSADLKRLKERWKTTLLAVERAGEARPLWNAPRPDRWALVVGSEAQGLSRRTLDSCDHVLEVPMRRSIPSINVASAATVAMYEMTRPQ